MSANCLITGVFLSVTQSVLGLAVDVCSRKSVSPARLRIRKLLPLPSWGGGVRGESPPRVDRGRAVCQKGRDRDTARQALSDCIRGGYVSRERNMASFEKVCLIA